MAPSRKPRARAALSVCKHDSGDCHQQRVYSTRRHPAPESDPNELAAACNDKRGDGKSKPKHRPAAPTRAVRRKDPKVEALVYRFLGNLAAIESDRRESIRSVRRRPAIHFSERTRGAKRRPHSEECDGARLRRRRFRSPTPYSWDRRSIPSNSAFVDSLLNDEPRLLVDSDSSPDDDDDDDNDDKKKKVAGAAGNRANRARQQRAARKHQADIARKLQLVSSTSELLNQQPTTRADRNLLQRIHRYLSDGIAEGKRRAQRYVRKALLFALETGYLKFADREGKLLEVSPDIQQGLALQRQQQQQQLVPENSAPPNTTNTTTTDPKAAPLSTNLDKCPNSSPSPGVPKAVPSTKSSARKRISRTARLQRRRSTRASSSKGKRRPQRRSSAAANKRSASRARAARRRLRAKSLNGAAAAAKAARRKRDSSLGATVNPLAGAGRQKVAGRSSGSERIKNCTAPCAGGARRAAKDTALAVADQKPNEQQQQSQQSQERPRSELKRESSRQPNSSGSSSRCACKDTSSDCNNEASASSARRPPTHGSQPRQNSQLRDESLQRARDRSKSPSSRLTGHNLDSQFTTRRSSRDFQDF